MKVLALFLHNSVWGKRIRGDERRFLEIAKRLISHRIELYVIEFYPSLQKEYYGKYVYKSIELQSCRILYLVSHLISLALKLRKKVDCIYVYNQDLFNVIGALIFKLIQKKPMMLVVQSLQDLEYPIKILRNMYNASIIDTTFLFLHRFLIYLSLKLADGIATTSNILRNNIITKFGWTQKKILITGNGIEHNKFTQLNLSKKYDAVYAGRIHILHKGLDKLLLVWKMITIKYPKAKLIIVGGYESEKDKKLLSDLINCLNLEDNVVVTGFVNDDELINILNSSKFFISLSKYEGFGLSVLEAISCGVPCVVSNLPVFRELHGNLLIYVNSQDYKIVVPTLYKILDNYQNFSLISTLLLNHAKKFSWNEVAIKELCLIKTLVHKH